MRLEHITASEVRAIVDGRSRGFDQTFGFSEHGNDFSLRVGWYGVIRFDTPEEAEEIAGAILAGLARAGLPHRNSPG